MNYYEILQIKPTASSLEIKQAYRRLVKKFHPDSQTSTANHEEIVKLNQAYEILSDRENKRIYDYQLDNNSSNSTYDRQRKNQSASTYYQHNRQQQKQTEIEQFQWLKDVYRPLSQLIHKILTPLEFQLEELSADPFDDNLMAIFADYLDSCRCYFEQARGTLASLPNPSQYAAVAVNLYYCLNHISDGIEELERFTQTYDESYLHTGKELFNLAVKINDEATTVVNRLI